MKTYSYESNLLSFERQLSFSEITTSGTEILKKRRIEKVIISGMGGSGLSGEIIAAMRTEMNIPIPVESHKTYGIPDGADKKTLLIFSSFSGETEEVLSGIREALKKRFPIAVVASGGRLLKIAKEKNIPYATFPREGLTPREAVGYNCYSVLSLLLARFPHIAVKTFSSAEIESETLSFQGKFLSEKIRGRFPILYSDIKFKGLLRVWKTNLNETGGMFVSVEYLPDMNHGEIAAAGDMKKAIVIFLEDPESSAKIRDRISASEKIFKKWNIPVVRIVLSGKSLQERIWKGIILSHWTSLFISKRKKINPKRTETIELFKKIIRMQNPAA